MRPSHPLVRVPAVLLERDHELDLLADARRDAAAGDGRLVVVEGAAGIGKTALLASAQRLAADEGFTVFTSQASDLERQYAFGVVRQLFETGVASDPWWADGAGAAARPAFEPGTGEVPSFDDVSLDVLHGLYWLVANASAERPVVLVVDDVQWSDGPSTRFIAFLGRRLEGLRVLILLGLRTQRGRQDAVIAEVLRQPTTQLVAPAPLTDLAVGRFLEDRLGAAPQRAFSTACRDATGGNPLLLDELARAMRTEHVPPETAGVDVIADLGPRAVSRTVLLRLARLDDGAVALARAVAVVGERGDLALLSAMTGLSDGALELAARHLIEAEILRPEPPLGFVHPLIREAVYDELSPLEREVRHARAAEFLRDQGRPNEQVAAHAMLLPPGGRPWVVEALREAARLAGQRGSQGTAVRYLRRALDEPPPADERPHLVLELGTAEAVTGDAAAAEHLRSAWQTLPDPRSRARAGALLIRLMLFTNAPDDVVAVARQAERELPPGAEDTRALLVALQQFAVHLGAHDDEPEHRVTSTRADASNDGPGARLLTAVAAWDGAMRGGSAGDSARLALVAMAGDMTADEQRGYSIHLATSTLILAEDEAVVAVLEALSSMRRLSSAQRSSIKLLQGWHWIQRGELAEAETTLRGYLDDADEQGGTLRYGLGWAVGHLIRALVERGDFDTARDVATRCASAAPGSDPDLARRRGLVELLLAEGRWTAALDAVDGVRAAQARVVNPAWLPVGSQAARALLGLGRASEAVAAAADEVGRARAWGAPGALGSSLRTFGTALDAAGSPMCLEVLADAVATTEGCAARLEHAKSLGALGSVMRRRGRPGDARPLLARGADLASICGAAPLLQRLEAELAAAGGRRTTRAVTGPAALTPSERRVALLAAGGRTNREIAQELFVTPKTVEIHLSSTYRKLGIGSRRDLETAGIG